MAVYAEFTRTPACVQAWTAPTDTTPERCECGPCPPKE